MSVIATAVKHLIAAGVSGDDLVRAIAEMEASTPKDAAAEKRRAWDRERKRAKKAANSGGIPPVPVENAERAKVPPHPPKNNPSGNNTPVPLKGDSPPLSDPADFEVVVTAWNAMALRAGLKPVRVMTAERRGRLRARLAEHGSDRFTEAIAAVERSPFCRGENDRGWQANFDFLLQPKSFTKLIEGSYDGKPSGGNVTPFPARSQHPGGRTGAASARAFGGA